MRQFTANAWDSEHTSSRRTVVADLRQDIEGRGNQDPVVCGRWRCQGIQPNERA